MIPTEKLLSILQERAQNSESLAECRLMLDGLSDVLSNLSINPVLPDYNRGLAAAAEDAAIRASNIKEEGNERGVFRSLDADARGLMSLTIRGDAA